jgi:hypothetical protein
LQTGHILASEWNFLAPPPEFATASPQRGGTPSGDYGASTLLPIPASWTGSRSAGTARVLSPGSPGLSFDGFRGTPELDRKLPQGFHGKQIRGFSRHLVAIARVLSEEFWIHGQAFLT